MKSYLQFINESAVYEADNYLDLYALYCKFLDDPELKVLIVKRTSYITSVLSLQKDCKDNCKVGNIVLASYFGGDGLDYYMIRLKVDESGMNYSQYTDKENFLRNLGNTTGHVYYDMYSAHSVINMFDIFISVDEYLYKLFNDGKIPELVNAYKKGAKIPQNILDQLKDAIKQTDWS